MSVNPYTGLQFFNLKFKGQRVVYELALKVSWAGVGWAGLHCVHVCLGLAVRGPCWCVVAALSTNHLACLPAAARLHGRCKAA